MSYSGISHCLEMLLLLLTTTLRIPSHCGYGMGDLGARHVKTNFSKASVLATGANGKMLVLNTYTCQCLTAAESLFSIQLEELEGATMCPGLNIVS